MPSALRYSFFMFLGASIALVSTPTPLLAQNIKFGRPYQDTQSNDSASTSQKSSHSGGEHYRAEGHRPPPPGYQDAPSVEFENGPDPDHQAQVKSRRDAVTGSDLRKFGSAYQDSNPVQNGQLGDATGNGWVAPRGNGF